MAVPRIFPSSRRRSFQDLARQFRRSEDGVTAIEFAVLATPFFALIAAILETAIIFFAGHVLDSAVQDATRLVRTGQAQEAGFDAADFKERICGRLYGLFDCDEIWLQVEEIDTFADAEGEIAATPLDPDCEAPCEWTIAESYDDGVGSSIILAQAYYKWPTIFNFGGFNLADRADGSRLLATVRVFRNEPFGG